MKTRLSTHLLQTVLVNVTVGASVIAGMAISYGSLQAIDLNPFAPPLSCPISATEKAS